MLSSRRQSLVSSNKQLVTMDLQLYIILFEKTAKNQGKIPDGEAQAGSIAAQIQDVGKTASEQ